VLSAGLLQPKSASGRAASAIVKAMRKPGIFEDIGGKVSIACDASREAVECDEVELLEPRPRRFVGAIFEIEVLSVTVSAQRAKMERGFIENPKQSQHTALE
jgi:hypothetical protein